MKSRIRTTPPSDQGCVVSHMLWFNSAKKKENPDGERNKKPKKWLQQKRKDCSWHLKSTVMALWWGEALKMTLIGFSLKVLAMKWGCSTNGKMVFLPANPFNWGAICLCLPCLWVLAVPPWNAAESCRENGMWLKPLQWELWVVKPWLCQWNNQMCLKSQGGEMFHEKGFGFLCFFMVFWFCFVVVAFFFKCSSSDFNTTSDYLITFSLPQEKASLCACTFIFNHIAPLQRCIKEICQL